MDRAHAVAQRLARPAPVRGRGGARAVLDVGRHGEDARHVLPAVGGRAVADIAAVFVHDKAGQVVGIVVVIAVLVHVRAVDEGVERGIAGPVRLQRLEHFRASDALFVENELFDGGKAVRRGADAHGLGAGVVVFRTAAGHVHPLRDAIVHQQREVRQRLHALVAEVHLVDRGDHAVAPVFHLLVKGFQHLVEAREGLQRAGVDGKLGVVVDAAAAVDRHVEDQRQVQRAGVVHAVGLPGDGRLHAADAHIAPRLLQRLAVAHQGLDDRRVVEDLRLAGADADDVEDLDLELPRGALVQAHAHPGVRDAGVGVGVQDHVAHVAGDILALGVHAAHVQRRAAHDGAGGEGDGVSVADLAELVHLDEEQLDQLLHLRAGQGAVFEVVFIEAGEEHVEAAVSHRVAVALDDDHVGGDVVKLQGLPEVPRRVFRHPEAVGGDALQLPAPDGVGLLPRHLLREGTVTADVGGRALHGVLFRFVKLAALHVLRAAGVQRLHRRDDLLPNAAEAEGEELFIVGADVADAGVDKQAAAVDALAEVRALPLLLRQRRLKGLAQRLVLPEGLDGVDVVLDLLVDDVAVVGAGLHDVAAKLPRQPVEGELRVDGRGAGLRRQLADDQLVGPDVDADVREDVPQNQAPLHVLRQMGVFFVALRDDHGALGVRGGIPLLRPLQQAVHPREGRRVLGQAGDAHAPDLVIGLHGQRSGIGKIHMAPPPGGRFASPC